MRAGIESGPMGGRKRRGAQSLAWMAAALSPGGAQAATDANLATSLSVGCVAFAIAAGFWALSEVRQQTRLKRALKAAEAKGRVDAAARDAVLDAGTEPVMVWGPAGLGARAYAGAQALLDSCLAGPDAMALSVALDALAEGGKAFDLTVRDTAGRQHILRGRVTGGLAALWFGRDMPASNAAAPAQSLLDTLPVPVWYRERDLTLRWGNRAFLPMAGSNTPEWTVNAAFEKADREFAASSQARGIAQQQRRTVTVDGLERIYDVLHVPLPGGEIAASAIDVTALAAAEARLQQHIAASADTLDRLATAVAIFDRDQKLSFYNRAFAELWELDRAWLDSHPDDGTLLDALRDTRKLPEQRDYQAWRRARLALYGRSSDSPADDLWHLPNGRTLRVVAQPHPFGGLTFLYEDVTERLSLESSYNTLIKVQSATLDTLAEGVAVFGPDARLKLSNSAFARIWQLEPQELAGEPRLQAIAESCIARFGDAATWTRILAAITSGGERRRDWGEIERSDKTVLGLAMSPLPDGATLVTFADMTDRFRIESALRDRAEALEAADRLKSDFVHHASFLFRDPLNAVQGFAEILASGSAGALTDKQREYVGDILSAANTLADVTSDILDLAMIDSGAMRLELARVNLYELLSWIAERLRSHADNRGVEFALVCRPDVGMVSVDPRRLRQIVFNLLSNAFKFTPRGGKITLGSDIQGDSVEIYVSDTGPGIAPDVKANVFDRFAAKGRTGQRAGAGLGLALVNRFVELHDGWVEIDSAVNRGTTVRCHLPRRVSDDYKMAV
jgi:signal transduction histidine kinase